MEFMHYQECTMVAALQCTRDPHYSLALHVHHGSGNSGLMKIQV
jgi:hypothetical protein